MVVFFCFSSLSNINFEGLKSSGSFSASLEYLESLIPKYELEDVGPIRGDFAS